ncbi:MAG: hypothetical protein KJ593_06835 [Candidatus Omnitrophica bacterium]|nr:hypothetical protein [Candidatus Omnitrophota bacterium]
MINFSLAFRPKRILSIIFFLLCFVIIIQLYLSLFLFRYTSKINNNIDESLGKIYLSAVTFDVVSGITLHNLAVIDNSTPPKLLFKAKRLSFGFDAFDVFLKKLNVNRLRCKDAAVYVDKDFKSLDRLAAIAKAAYEEFLKNQIIPLEVDFKNPNVIVKALKFIFIDSSQDQGGVWLAKLGGRILIRKEEIFSQGSLTIECKFLPDSSFARFFRRELLVQNLGYEFLANLKDNEFLVERFDLSLGYDHITGNALVKNFKSKTPLINVIINSSNLSIENIQSLVKDFGTHGTFNLAANVRGPVDDLKFVLALNFLGASSHYAPLPLVKNIVGKVYLTDRGLKVDNLFFIVNDIPLRLNSEIRQKKDIIKLTADIIIKDPDKAIAFLPRSIEAKALFKKKGPCILGNAEVTFESADNNLNSLKIEDFKFSQEEDKGLLSINGIIFSVLAKKAEGEKDKQLNFSNLSANLDFNEKGLEIKNILLSGFNGKVSGDLNIESSPVYKHTLRLHAEGINAAEIQTSLNLPYNLLGEVSAKLFVRSQGNQFCEGVLLIQDGQLKETAILLGLSEYMKIKSLKVIDFDRMQLNFSFLEQGIYRYGLKSWGKDAILKTNMHINNDNQVSGYFSAQFSQEVLAESAQFKKLLKVIGDVSPFVEFPFTLRGTIHTPRLSWVRNDFKRSLERRIPGWYRRGMQRDIDSVIDEMFTVPKAAD